MEKPGRDIVRFAGSDNRGFKLKVIKKGLEGNK